MTSPNPSSQPNPEDPVRSAPSSITDVITSGWFVMLIVVATMASCATLAALFPARQVGTDVPFSRVAAALRQHRVASVGFDYDNTDLQARLKDGTIWNASFDVTEEGQLNSLVSGSGVRMDSGYPATAPMVSGVPGPAAVPGAGWLWSIPVALGALSLLLAGLWAARSLSAERRLRDQAHTARSPLGGVGRHHLGATSPTVGPVAEKPSTRFSDVAGAEEAVAQLAEIVSYLRHPERFTSLGAKLPRGALLCGPPGTGKTLLGRAVAGEAGVAFFSSRASDYDNTFIGAGANAVRALFTAARAAQPAIVFIDEIDSVGRKRSADGSASDEKANTLNALLAEMDGFDSKDAQVVVIGATNLPSLLDPALVRPGRLSRKVTMGLPDRAGRQAILAVHTAGKPLAADVDLAAMAARTSGMSGAELAEVVNEGCLEAARLGRQDVNMDCLEAALATVAMGQARHSAVVSDSDREITAWHEAGHTVTAMCVPGARAPVAVSILPRGEAGGVTWMAGSDDQYLSVTAAHARLAVAMGGRAAEELLLGSDFTSGASSDLETATQLAISMATQFGMTDLGLAVRRHGWPTGADNAAVTAKVECLLGDARQTALITLEENRSLLEAIVSGLLEHDTLNEAALTELRSRFVPDC